MSEFAILATIAVLSVVQSIFGVGVLIFGTPILLLAGFGFEKVLSILLPASLTISVLQVVLDRGVSKNTFREFSWRLLPAAIAGICFALVVRVPMIDVLVSIVLIVIAYFRVSERRRVHLVRIARKHGGAMLALTGALHGLTNLGGSLLEAYVSSLHNDKTSMRQNTAIGYAMLALVQLGALAAFQRLQFGAINLMAAMVAGAVFITVGRICFLTMPEQPYRVLVSAVMVCAATALVAKRFVVTAA